MTMGRVILGVFIPLIVSSDKVSQDNLYGGGKIYTSDDGHVIY